MGIIVLILGACSIPITNDLTGFIFTLFVFLAWIEQVRQQHKLIKKKGND